MNPKFTPGESQVWLMSRMEELEIANLATLQAMTGINKGTLSKYFRHQQRPSIDVIPKLCEVLHVSPEALLIALGVLNRK